MSGAAPKRKGSAFEREIEELLLIFGIPAQRVPLSGAIKTSKFDHDISCTIRGIDRRIECKRRRRAFATIDKMLGDNFAVIVRDDRSRPLVIMALPTFADLAIDLKPLPPNCTMAQYDAATPAQQRAWAEQFLRQCEENRAQEEAEDFMADKLRGEWGE